MRCTASGATAIGADGLFVTLVTDVEHRVALLGANLEFVMDLGDERTDGVDDRAAAARAASMTSGGEPWALSMTGAPGGTVVDVVDEDDAEGLEVLDDELVVNDLVVAVDRRLEDPRHPVECLNGLFDAGAKPPGCCEDDSSTLTHSA